MILRMIAYLVWWVLGHKDRQDKNAAVIREFFETAPRGDKLDQYAGVTTYILILLFFLFI